MTTLDDELPQCSCGHWLETDGADKCYQCCQQACESCLTSFPDTTDRQCDRCKEKERKMTIEQAMKRVSAALGGKQVTLTRCELQEYPLPIQSPATYTISWWIPLAESGYFERYSGQFLDDAVSYALAAISKSTEDAKIDVVVDRIMPLVKAGGA